MALCHWLNLVVPGVGLVLTGHLTSGWIVGVIFAAAANCAIIGGLIMPDDVSPSWVGLAIGVTGGAYAGAQIRLAQSLREDRLTQRIALRHEALRRVRTALEAHDPETAWRALQPIQDLAADDLLVAYRLAQVLTAREDVDNATAAWEHLRRLDRHRIYSDTTRRHLARESG